MSLYEEKFVLFADILGWGDLVCKSEKDETIQRHLYEIMKILFEIDVFTPEANTAINKVIGESEGIPAGSGYASVKTIQFSDSLVFTFDNTLMSFVYVYGVMSALSSILASIGYFFRGGIDYGNIHHENGIIFGPAMNNAYLLESKKATVPRILFSERAKEVFLKLKAPSEFTFLDSDSLCLNNFNHIENMESVKRIVNDKIIMYADNDKVRPKYLWVKNRFSEL